MKIEEIKELASVFGWVDLGEQKNRLMLSFRNEANEDRMNVYYTTMTVTVQTKNGSLFTYRNADTASKLEDIFTGKADINSFRVQ